MAELVDMPALPEGDVVAASAGLAGHMVRTMARTGAKTTRVSATRTSGGLVYVPMVIGQRVGETYVHPVPRRLDQ